MSNINFILYNFRKSYHFKSTISFNHDGKFSLKTFISFWFGTTNSFAAIKSLIISIYPHLEIKAHLFDTCVVDIILKAGAFIFFMAIRLGFAWPPSHLLTVEATLTSLAKLFWVRKHRCLILLIYSGNPILLLLVLNITKMQCHYNIKLRIFLPSISIWRCQVS